MQGKHITWHQPKISRQDRNALNGHKSCVLWFTGLSASGKSTLSIEVERLLFQRGIRTYTLDGDNVRHGLNSNLGFSPEDRTENIRRIGEVSKLFVDAGVFVLTAFISPYQADRQMVRELFAEGDFIEIYVKCSIEECEIRDPKGLYSKARKGELKEFTGISAPYEAPEHSELVIETDKLSIEQSVQKVIQFLEARSYITKMVDVT